MADAAIHHDHHDQRGGAPGLGDRRQGRHHLVGVGEHLDPVVALVALRQLRGDLPPCLLVAAREDQDRACGSGWARLSGHVRATATARLLR